MDVEAALLGRIQHRLRQDQAISGHYRDIRPVARQILPDASAFFSETGWRTSNPQLLGAFMHRRGLQLFPAPAGRGGWV